MPRNFPVVLSAALLVSLLAATPLHAEPSAGERSTPDFGPNVFIFDPAQSTIQKTIDDVFATQERGQFNERRFAFLFKPGKYNLDLQVGFYTHVAGLGRSPDDVEIEGAVRSKAGWMRGNATCNFWRCAENLSVVPTIEGSADVWAVSQGTALRRVHIKGDLNLSDDGWSSGGFLADCAIDGAVDSGTQQQWLSRNSEWSSWHGGNWNMVFVGTTNPPAGAWPDRPYTVVDNTPIVREKPYLTIDEAGRYFVMVPKFEAGATRGTTWRAGPPSATPIPIEQFYLARPDRDDATSINAALAAGKNLLLTPGVYHLSSSIRVTRPNTIVLGLGYPTLVADGGTVAMSVADVDGVVICGILFEAGAAESPTLLQVGEPGSKSFHAKNPIFLYDIFCRAGGAAVGTATAFVTIDANNVVGDNFWLWRADHGSGAAWNANKNRNGLVVNGDDVTFYGLFVEHCQQYQTIWNGNGGRVYFYQSEMPYDPPSQAAWSHAPVRGFASYKVAEGVTTHEAWGLGVYCVFYRAPVIADTAIEAPTAPSVKFHHLITVRLSGRPNSGIGHVLNDQGDPVITAHEARLN
jgi:hypothetical protein